MTNPIALLVADIHLSDNPPLARSAEPDWFKAMARQLRQLRALQAEYGVPIVCSGDVFDRYRSSPALINFAMDELPEMYSIPGQHDLPNHRLEDIEKSAYWTLVKAGVLKDLAKHSPRKDGAAYQPKSIENRAILYPFPWGEPATSSLYAIAGDYFSIAVVHAYCWSPTSGGYPGAPEDQTASKFQERLRGFDVAVFGDNHGQFSVPHDGWYAVNKANGKQPAIWNCGTFFRRKSDERNCRPCIGILYDDGTITPHYMDVSEDKWLAQDDLKTLDSEKFDFDALVGELAELSPDSLDFKQMLEQCMVQRGTGAEVRSLVLACCE